MIKTDYNKKCSCGCGKIVQGFSPSEALVFFSDDCMTRYFSTHIKTHDKKAFKFSS